MIDASQHGVEPGTDCTESLQHCIDDAIRNGECVIQLPAGELITRDTIHLGSKGRFSTLVLRGAEPATYSLPSSSTTLRCEFNDRPAINVQAARCSRVEGLSIRSHTGRDWNRPNNPDHDWPQLSSQLWKDIGTHGQHDFSCGITFDDMEDGRGWSSNCTISGCDIQGWHVGVATRRNNKQSQGDFLTVKDTYCRQCHTGVAITNSQARQTTIDGCQLTECFYGIRTGNIGAGKAESVYVTRTAFDRSTHCFDCDLMNWAGGFVADRCYGELIGDLGRVKHGAVSQLVPMEMTNCYWKFAAVRPTYYHFNVFKMNASIRNCNWWINVNDPRRILTFLNQQPRCFEFIRNQIRYVGGDQKPPTGKAMRFITGAGSFGHDPEREIWIHANTLVAPEAPLI